MCKRLQFKGGAHRDEEASQIPVVKLMKHLPFFTRQTAFHLLKNVQVLLSLMFSLMKTPFKEHPAHFHAFWEGAPHFVTGGACCSSEETAVTCEGLGKSRPEGLIGASPGRKTMVAECRDVNT